jgi:hypothetical protein
MHIHLCSQFLQYWHAVQRVSEYCTALIEVYLLNTCPATRASLLLQFGDCEESVSAILARCAASFRILCCPHWGVFAEHMPSQESQLIASVWRLWGISFCNIGTLRSEFPNTVLPSLRCICWTHGQPGEPAYCFSFAIEDEPNAGTQLSPNVKLTCVTQDSRESKVVDRGSICSRSRTSSLRSYVHTDIESTWFGDCLLRRLKRLKCETDCTRHSSTWAKNAERFITSLLNVCIAWI